MQQIVVYESVTGFTEQYAKWTAEALGCECRPLKGLTAQELSRFDRVIFGGWVMAGSVSGLNKLRLMAPTPAAVFAVGATPASDEYAANMRVQNKLVDIPFFYMEGGIKFEQLSFPKRLLLSTIDKMSAKKEGGGSTENVNTQPLSKSFDHSQKAQIAPLVEHMRGGK